ncbi:MAG: hypothetical protein JSS89_03390 [Bacteroidetes bacterium]|nr:hypothetical protein [Bacteroidota bacterium]
MPPSDGTLLVNPNPSLGGAGMVYSTPAAQDTATQSRYLFNVQYGNVAAGPLAAVGARISSSSIGPSNATALTLEAVAGAGAISRGLTIAASGGGTNVAIEITSGSIVSSGGVQFTALSAGANTDDVVTIDVSGNIRRTTASTVVGGAAWLLGGNATTSTQNIGTTSNFGITFITNSVPHLTITNAGAITQAASAGQVTFTGNVDANKDLAVAGAARYLPQTASAMNGSAGGTIVSTATFVKQSVSNNTSGAPKDVKLPTSGTDGQILFLRLSVANSGGTDNIRILNADNSLIETLPANINSTRFYQLMYSTADTQWMILSSQVIN